jgi:hypothetical protein
LRRLKANVKPVRYLAMPDGSELDESLMKRLLELLASFPNRSLAIAALQKAVRLLQQGQEVRPHMLTLQCLLVLPAELNVTQCTDKLGAIKRGLAA